MEKEIMGKVKDEPTREQIKEAFKKTIERWEKIVEDVDYYYESNCSLCYLSPDCKGLHVCHGSCPIRNYGDSDHSGCNYTPFQEFYADKTPANALAELNFLRKVYIWWMEGEARKRGWGWQACIVEEKKEEWVDVTEDIEWRLHNSGGVFWIRGYYKSVHIVWLDTNGINKQGQELHEIKIKEDGMAFRILKKQ